MAKQNKQYFNWPNLFAPNDKAKYDHQASDQVIDMDQFERQLEELANQHQFPIDAEELGFAQMPELRPENIEENERFVGDQDNNVKQIDVISGLPLFAFRLRNEPNTDPKCMKFRLTHLSKAEVKRYLQQLTDEFPEINERFEVNQQMPNEWAQLFGIGEPEPPEIDEENEENHETIHSIKREIRQKKNIKNNKIELADLLKRAIKNNSETVELRNLKHMMEGSNDKLKTSSLPPIRCSSIVLPSAGTAHLEDMDSKLLQRLFDRFTFQGLLILSKVSSKWNRLFDSKFECQSYLWFSNEDNNCQRFYPIEDCCEQCHEVMDSEPVIRVISGQLRPVIDEVLVLTNNLKCLRLYRFEMNKIFGIKRLAENCPQLQHLDLTECYHLCLADIEAFCSSYPQLKHLILTATDLNEEMLAHIIESMSKLETLSVGCTSITGESFGRICDSLKRLDIRQCPKLNTKALIRFLTFSGNIQLQHLKIDSYKNKEVFRLIWSMFKQSMILLEVEETPTEAFNWTSYVADIPLLPSIESLKLGRNVVLENRILVNFITSCPNIRSFTMRFDSRVDDLRFSEQTLLQMAIQWTHLESLELIGCQFIGKHFIESLQRLNSLEYLNLSESLELSDNYMPELLPNLLKLNYLVLDNCPNLGKPTLDSAITMAETKSPQLFRISMIRCKLQNLAPIKAKHLPKNARITYSSLYGRRYVTFDGQRTKIGNISQIIDFLNEK